MSADTINPALAKTNAEIAPILKTLEVFNAGEKSFNANAALLKHGRQFKTVDRLPPGLRKGETGQCYKNCTSAMMQYVGDRNPLYSYAEGYALDVGLGVVYEHAWLVDAAGRAIDLTWREPEGAVYYGVTFKLDALLEAMRTTEVYGVLFNSRFERRMFSEPAAFASMLSLPGLPGLPRGTIT